MKIWNFVVNVKLYNWNNTFIKMLPEKIAYEINV